MVINRSTRTLLGGAVIVLGSAGRAIAASDVDAALHCHEIVLRGSVHAGQAYASTIGEGLELRLSPTQYYDPKVAAPLNGWYISLEPKTTSGAREPGDRIYPVNPPLRFNPTQDIGTSYGVAASEKLGSPITYLFAADEAGFRKIRDLANDALWPYAAKDRSHPSEDYLDALNTISVGSIRFIPMQYSLEDAGASIVNLSFVIEVLAPEPFGHEGLSKEALRCIAPLR